MRAFSHPEDWCYNNQNLHGDPAMQYRVAKPLPHYQLGQTIDIDPSHPYHQRLEAAGVIEPVAKKPKAEKREKKVVAPKEVKDDRQDD